MKPGTSVGVGGTSWLLALSGKHEVLHPTGPEVAPEQATVRPG